MTDTLPPPPPVRRSSRGLRIALTLSLLVNLIILGLVLGAAFGRDHDRRFGDFGLGPFFAALPDDARAQIGAALKSRGGDLRQNRAAMRAEFQTMLAALRSDSFDADTFRASVEAQQGHLEERQDIARGALFDSIATMTAEQRRAFADALEEVIKRGPRHRDRKK